MNGRPLLEQYTIWEIVLQKHFFGQLFEEASLVRIRKPIRDVSSHSAVHPLPSPRSSNILMVGVSQR